MNDEIQLLLEFHKIQVARSEHYERERATMSALVLALASGLVGVATFDQRLSLTDILLGVLVSLCGVLGLAVSRLHYFRSLRHGRRAAAYRAAIAGTYPRIDEIKDRVDVEHAESGRKSDLRLHHVWTMLHFGIVVVGGVLALLALISTAVDRMGWSY